MNDQEALDQVAQMANFIMTEARTTADSLQRKAIEDFNVEKLKLVQSMKENIRTDLEAQKKSQVTSKAIEKSTAINRARLSKIEARHQCIEILGKECKKRLGDVSQLQDKYKSILVDLIVQGALKLSEPAIAIRCRQADAGVVKQACDQAQSKYAQVVKQQAGASVSVKLSVDNKQFLDKECSGGVVLSCQDGSIIVDNTLDARLKLVMEAERPELRKMLFPNR